MGILLSIPMAVVAIVSAIIRKDIVYCFYYGFIYIYLKICDLLWKKRLDVYDILAVGQPEKTGFYIPQKEWELDTPKKSQSLQKFSDDAFCFGTNSKSEYFAVYISRRPNNFVQCSVFLRLSDGKLYHLPKEHLLQKATSEDNTFGSSRLKMQCLVPLRKWRIFFNGILEKHSSDKKEDSSRYKHVKFTLIWTASTDVFDFSCDMSKHILSHTEASEKSVMTVPTRLINKLKSIFDSYDQPGMILGTMQIEDEEEREIYLWGARGRFMGKKANIVNGKIVEIFANFENGSVIRLGTLSIPWVSKRFPYGYIMRSSGIIDPIEELESDMESSNESKINITCVSDKHKYVINVVYKSEENINFRKEVTGSSTINIADIEMNGKKGRCFIFRGIMEGTNILDYQNRPFHIPRTFETSLALPLTISFEKERCQDSTLCGGKGSSLAKLFALSNSSTANTKFTVPNGIVVTTEAYRDFIKGPLEILLEKFQKDIWCGDNANIEELCQKTVDVVTLAKLPNHLSQLIIQDLTKLFGDLIHSTRVSVRSSALGEDTEQMSSAGQMATYLGVQGMNHIFEAVIKCWASQFTFRAIEYKRRYGQILNMPMAVVIQEMVSCEAAGVMFTCDPRTGNPSHISITANWGLGESVVSASAEPDTIRLNRNLLDKVNIHSKELGSKKTYIVMDDKGTGGTKVETDDNKSTVCCINEETALKLGKIAIEIEGNFGSSQDIEWGTVDGNIFLLQSRPVTSIDIETDFEAKHIFDTYQRIEDDFFTKANVGEVLPGATSPLGMDLLEKYCNVTYPRQIVRWDGGDSTEKPFFIKGMITSCNHYFFCLTDGFFRFSGDDIDFTNAFVVSMFGRLIEDKEIRRVSKERHSVLRKTAQLNVLSRIKIAMLKFLSGAFLRFQEKKILKREVPYTKDSSSHEILYNFGKQFEVVSNAFGHHMNCSFVSSIWNMPVLRLLAKTNGAWNNTVYGDFAYLLSTCKDVVSADVPSAIEDLARAIARTTEPELFKKMKSEEAIYFLETNTLEAGLKYKQFMEKHGHRSKKEFDVISTPWRVNPQPLIITLQGLVNKGDARRSKCKPESLWTVISKLQIKFNFFQKLQLLWLVFNAQRGVRDREYSKSFAIKIIDKLRMPIHRMSEVMVQEGHLPRKELMFFLTIEEIIMLLKTRSPRLVSKALKRWKWHNDLDKLIFPEILIGNPKPINDTGNVIASEKGLIMRGVPVSQGIAKSIGRVVMYLEEVENIQPGDILITYSTDIAWSPYFPLLSGVVTELGGLISHGAVVAREYGLPCVVGLHGATKAFKSGDLVILNGNKGTLQRVESS